MKTHAFPRLLLLCGLALSGLGCTLADTPARTTPSAKLWTEIQAEVGDAACDSQAQCHSIAVGAKACGGPDGYLAWSAKRSDAARLQALVAKHAAARKEENLRDRVISNCMFQADPGASCEAARCTLRRRGLVSPPAPAD